MTVPTVSVVIPARDDATALEACLRALARQTVAPLEVVVVDNASTDGTAEVAARHGARVLTENRIGIAPAAATGYDAALGEVIGRLDADSRPPEDWVARVARTFAARPEVDAVTGAGAFYDLPNPLGAIVVRGYLGAYYALGRLAAADRVVWGSNMAVRREAWADARARVHRDDPDVHDDMDLSLVQAGRWVVHHDPGLVVGVSARSVRGGRAQLGRRLRRALRTLALSWAEVPPSQRWVARVRERWAGRLRERWVARLGSGRAAPTPRPRRARRRRAGARAAR